MKDGKERIGSTKVSPMGREGIGAEAHGSRENDDVYRRAIFRFSVHPNELLAVVHGPDAPSVGEIAELMRRTASLRVTVHADRSTTISEPRQA